MKALGTPLIALTALVALTGCPYEEYPDYVRLYPRTQAPPAATAELEHDDNREIHTVNLSKGVAMAVSCSSSCDDGCEVFQIDASPPDLVDVRPAYAPSTGSYYYLDNMMILVGKTKGSGAITVTTSCATQTYTTTVTPAPVPDAE